MGILEGRIPPENLHTGTLFNGKWILPFNENAAFEWKVGDKVRFKVDGAGTVHLTQIGQEKANACPTSSR
jgi:hypothetical protein